MSIKENIKNDLVLAMKSGDEMKKKTLRLVSGAIKNEEIANKEELKDEQTVAVLSREHKRVREAKVEFEKGGRDDLVKEAEGELEIIGAYLPEQMSDEDIEEKVRAVVSGLGLSGSQDMGRAMGAVMKELKGKADGTRVREILSRVLSE